MPHKRNPVTRAKKRAQSQVEKKCDQVIESSDWRTQRGCTLRLSTALIHSGRYTRFPKEVRYLIADYARPSLVWDDVTTYSPMVSWRAGEGFDNDFKDWAGDQHIEVRPEDADGGFYMTTSTSMSDAGQSRCTIRARCFPSVSSCICGLRSTRLDADGKQQVYFSWFHRSDLFVSLSCYSDHKQYRFRFRCNDYRPCRVYSRQMVPGCWLVPTPMHSYDPFAYEDVRVLHADWIPFIWTRSSAYVCLTSE